MIQPLGLILVFILVFLAGFLSGRFWASRRSPQRVDGPAADTAGPVEEVELIKRCGEQWVRIGSRHPNHPDVHNVRAGLEPGVFVRGEQPDA